MTSDGNERALVGSGITAAEAQTRLARAFHAAALDTPALDARLLVAGVLEIAPARLPLAADRLLDAAEAAIVASHGRRRLRREPVSRILGRRAFHDLELEVTAATLDPRPDTETLVDGVLALVHQQRTPSGHMPRIADIGTGTGAILIALLARLPAATGIAVDVDAAALAVAARNAARHGVAARMSCRRTSWLDDIEGPFDLIVSNPPYIPRGDIATLDPEVRQYDPHLALDGGTDGLDAYRVLMPAAGPKLAPGGWLVLEIGIGQEAPLRQIATSLAWPGPSPRIEVWPDLSGRTRCVAIQHHSCPGTKNRLDSPVNQANVSPS